MSKHSQMSIEFVLLTSFAFLLVFIISLYMLSEVGSLQNERESLLVQDIALVIQGELNLASVVQDGYFRNFSIPYALENINYTIQQQNSSITVKSKKGIFTVLIPDVKGNVTKGYNAVKKEGGVIYINQ